jgi:hypothetical protein
MGFESLPAADHRKQEAVLRAGHFGELADSFDARSRHSVGLCRKRRDRHDGRAKGKTIPLFFGNFLLKLILLT